jgi:hypothetical protein
MEICVVCVICRSFSSVRSGLRGRIHSRLVSNLRSSAVGLSLIRVNSRPFAVEIYGPIRC